MAFQRKYDFDLVGRVSFRIPVSLRDSIQAKAEKEQKTVSELLRAETINTFRQKV
jgi:hypothetical protein